MLLVIITYLQKIYIFLLVWCKTNYNHAKTFSGEAEYFSEKNPLSVDHYHYFTQDKITKNDVLGVAKTLRLNYGNGTKSKNRGSFCIDEQKQRFAISEYRGLIDDWDIQKLEAVRVRTIATIKKIQWEQNFKIWAALLYLY